MSDISRAGGPFSVSNAAPRSDDKSVTTVQVGENKLSDVAGRLGLEPQDLQKANLQLSDTSVLKAGQEIKLPQNQGSQGPQEPGERDDDRNKTSQPPSSPIGDSLVKGFIQSKLAGVGEQTEFSQKDLGQVSGGASAGKFQKDYFAKWEPTEGNSSSGASAGKYQPEFQKIHLADDARFQKGSGDEFKPIITSEGTLDGKAYGKESLSQSPGHADFQINKVIDKSSPLLFEKVAGGEPLEQHTLDYQKIKVAYDAQKTGGPSDSGTGSPKGYDLEKLKPW